MFSVPFFDLQNFILLVRTVPFLRKIFFISSYTAKNNYFLLYELIQDLPYFTDGCTDLPLEVTGPDLIKKPLLRYGFLIMLTDSIVEKLVYRFRYQHT